MSDPFFDHPILNSPYEYPKRHWELDDQGQPTQQIIEQRRRAQFITPIPKPKKRKELAAQQQIIFDEGKGLSSEKQQYDITATINRVRQEVDAWRNLPSPTQVTPETARLLQHWRHHKFNDIRPFFCQVEAVETLIWLTEVAPHFVAGKSILEHLSAASTEANPELQRLGLKLATGAGKTTVMARSLPGRRSTLFAVPGVSSSRAGFLLSRPVSRSRTAFVFCSRTIQTAITKVGNLFQTNILNNSQCVSRRLRFSHSLRMAEEPSRSTSRADVPTLYSIVTPA